MIAQGIRWDAGSIESVRATLYIEENISSVNKPGTGYGSVQEKPVTLMDRLKF